MKKLFFIVVSIISITSYSQEIQEIQKILTSDGGSNHAFGRSVSISEDYALIGNAGGYSSDNGAGSAYIFQKTGGIWNEVQKLVPSDGSISDFFGVSSCISGDYAIISSYGDDDYGERSGSAYIFYNDKGNWIEQTKLIPSDGFEYDEFGCSVSISGDFAIIGSKLDDDKGSNSGSVYIYYNNSGTWEFYTKLTASDGSGEDHFGFSVSISNDYAVVGAIRDNDNGINSGSAYIFYNDNGTWVENTKITANDGSENDNFGSAVDINENYVIVGAYTDDVNAVTSGSAYIFHNINGFFEFQTKLYLIDANYRDFFGYSVNISDKYAVIGGYNSNLIGEASSLAYIFYNNAGNWIKYAQLKPADSNPSDQFGCAVCIDSKNNILIGAREDDDLGERSGSAYYFNVRGISGHVYNDISENCLQDQYEIGLPKRKLIIIPGDIIAETDRNGMWFINSLQAGDYTITADTTGKWLPTCSITQNFTVIHPDSLTIAPSFGFVSTEPCAEPEVSVNMPFIRPCFSNQKIYVQACNTNTATGVLTDAYVELELDSLITPTNSSIPYTDLGDNLYRFDIGMLNPGMCEYILVETDVSCDAELGQTLCIQANLFPADSCVFDTIPTPGGGGVTPCEIPWDKSSLCVKGWCQNDSVYFSITNTGDLGEGDMLCWSEVRIYIDGEFMQLDSVMLAGGETQIFAFAGDGRTWRLEADQHPLHPGNSHPNATVENCGNTDNWTPGLYNLLPHDDADPVVDIYCGEVTGSYDPNDKAASPAGVGMEHFIYPDGKLDYTIRFQNTGTDTAFTVLIRDTLETDLDIFTVEPGASSHNYSFRMYGPRVLEWRFYNILLPDSNINEPESHGFVSFTVKQVADLPNGTEINNNAGIYFDYNEPVITNTTSHIINRDLIMPSWTEKKTITFEECIQYTYNGIVYTQSGKYWQVVSGGANPDTLITIDLTINTADVSVSVNGNTITAGAPDATYQWVDCDNADAPIEGETNQSFSASINGNYAVIVTQNGCTDMSSCVQIAGVDIDKYPFDKEFKLYPNPTDGILTVKGVYEFVQINIRNFSDQTVQTGTYRNENEIVLHLQGKTGIYFIEIISEKNVHQFKIVKY